ncbi:MAG TPA: hypothetical protein VMT11_09710 [Myxococcaceae bacterium]|nr:hypothetical protein [Myxococcaceae bacterium]
MSNLSGHSPPEHRCDTPTPGWESGVWVRIQRSRRNRRLGALTLAAALGVGGALVAGRRAPDTPGPVWVSAALDGTLRPDGSAPLHGLWRLTFEGAELRVYRNALGVVERCPGSPGCTRTEQGGTLALPVGGPGEYRAVVFSSPLSGGGRTLHEDIAAAHDRGAPVEMSPALVAY